MKRFWIVLFILFISTYSSAAKYELDSDGDNYLDMTIMPLDELWTFQAGVTISTGQAFTLGTTQWDDGSDAIDGEQIADDTIDNDSIDWSDMTDLTTDGAVSWGNLAEGELANSTIVSADIKDGVIVNADINASAVIVQSKLATLVGADETYASGWGADTGLAEKDDIYDYLHSFDDDDDGSFTDETWFDNIPDTAFTALTAGDSYGSFGGASDDTIDELFAAIDASWPAGATENDVEGYIFDADAEAISGNWEVQDDVHFSFGNDDDASWAWDAAAVRLEIRDVSDVWKFAFDLANSSLLVAAVATPESGLYDSGATGSARTDEYCAGYGGNITDPTEDAVISDMTLHAMITSKITWGEWDGSDEAFILGDSGTGEDLKFDFEVATDNQVEISSNSAADTILASGITIAALNKPIEITENTTLSDAQVHGRYILMTAACTTTLPAISSCGIGSSVMVVVRDAAEQAVVDSNADDTIYLRDGTSVGDGDSIDIPAGAKHFVVLHAMDAVGWYILGESDTCTDGGAS